MARDTLRGRKQRLQLLRFRELDARAREALRAMLESLPAPPAAESFEAGSARSPEEVLENIGRVLARAGPLDSPLAHFAARLTESGELALVLVQRAEGEPREPVPPPAERALARVRRSGQAGFQLVRAADSMFHAADSLPPTPDNSRDG